MVGQVYIRGCQEHFSPSAGGAGLVRDIQPPVTVEDARVVSCPWVIRSQQLHLVSSDDANQFRNGIKPCGCTVSTMGLSEARGLVLFRVIRGGIGVTQRLGARRHRVVYRPFSYSPSNPSVSRTDWPPPEKITGDGRALHPRRSSGLRF